MNVESLLNDTAANYGVSVDAARAMWEALVRGNGSMAQFNHYELGGSGQWMAGGMTMVGDMFNYGLKSKVDGICNALSSAAREASQQLYSGNVGSFQSQSQGSGNNFAYSSSSNQRWWPEGLGAPNSVGSQNDLQYAYFAGPRRLVVNRAGSVTVYDTLGHSIGGVSQQQGGYDSLTFTSQYGTVRVSDLPIVDDANPNKSGDLTFDFSVGPSGNENNNTTVPASSVPQSNFAAPSYTQPNPASVEVRNTEASPNRSGEDPISLLEKLGKLRDAGILTDDEFSAKKAELLKRI